MPGDPGPTPPDLAQPASLPWKICVGAIGEWRESSRLAREARPMAEGRDDLEKWLLLTHYREIEASRALLRAILAFDDGVHATELLGLLKRSHAPRAIESRGTLYIASPTCDPGEESSGVDAMDLVVMPASAVVDLDRV